MQWKNGSSLMKIDQQGNGYVLSGGRWNVEMYNKGMGKRSWRYVLLLEDNNQMTYVEEETPDGSRN